MYNRSGMTAELFCGTANALSLEELVPRSPGIMIGNRARLCAGAAVVYQAAALKNAGRDLTRLAEKMVTLGKGYILRKATELQLDPAIVERVVLKNDSCRDDERRDRMVQFLQELAVDT